MNIVYNLDLLSVGIAVAGIFILGFTIFFTDRHSITNRSFLFFSIFAAVWSAVNYSYYQFSDVNVSFLLLKLVIFFGIWFVFFLFRMLYVFPLKEKVLPSWFNYVLFPITAVTSIITVTPLVFQKVLSVDQSGRIAQIQNGPGIFLFAGVALFLVFGGIFILIKKLRGATQKAEKSQITIMSIGLLITFALIMTFNLIFPAFLNNARYIPLGALFIFPFIALTFYAIYKHHLFNLRAAAVAGLTIVLTVASFIEIIFSDSLSSILLRSSVFLIVLAVSILMNRFVGTIAEQREALQVANKGQENLIHIMNHQIKGYLGKGRMIFAELLTEPSYGPIGDAAKPMLDEGFRSLTEGVSFVEGILNSSSASSGQLNYTMEKIDFRKIVNEVSEKQKSTADTKGLKFSVNISAGDYNMTGDKRQLEQAVRNLIDNSIQYTEKGSIAVDLTRSSNKIVLSVKDTGVGISPEDRSRLFTAGGRGKDSIRINVNSTGYGLSFVKNVAEAHHGTVGVDSAGPGLGSRFFMELPVNV